MPELISFIKFSWLWNIRPKLRNIFVAYHCHSVTPNTRCFRGNALHDHENVEEFRFDCERAPLTLSVHINNGDNVIANMSLPLNLVSTGKIINIVFQQEKINNNKKVVGGNTCCGSSGLVE
jgi:hypothetical protein